MSFEITKFWIKEFSLSPTDEETNSGRDFMMNINSSVDFNATNSTDFRVNMVMGLHSNKEFHYTATQTAIFRFENSMTNEQAMEIAKTIPVRETLYPYLRAFTLSTLKTAGYDGVTLPVNVFKE
ncbi:protein-export chaperone SecB [Rosenbergiella epipactidis]|uniref:protein-export chaperone SecB n=1 Tax=Rosenbergiella epipactidis TaxID=1544694 RepID=UPI001F4DC712|nr:protein-export chaperone SecB [Rosenbergiella epipactidis]